MIEDIENLGAEVQRDVLAKAKSTTRHQIGLIVVVDTQTVAVDVGRVRIGLRHIGTRGGRVEIARGCLRQQ